MSQHTTGPWIETELFFGQPNRMVVYAGEQLIADCGLVDWETPVRANARLIAAAPDLLETCKMLLWYYEAFRDKSPKGPTELDDIANAREAIARAVESTY